MVEPVLRQYLIDLYYRNLAFGIKSTYKNYKYIVENEKLVLKGILDLQPFIDSIENKNYIFIDPYFEVYSMKLSLPTYNPNYNDSRVIIELGDSFEKISSCFISYLTLSNNRFYNNVKLKANSVTEIDSYAFYDFNSVDYLFCKNLNVIHSYAFMHTCIKEVYAPRCELIERKAFSDCYSIMSIKVNSMTQIDSLDGIEDAIDIID